MAHNHHWAVWLRVRPKKMRYKFGWIIASVGIWIGLLLVPGNDDKSLEILQKGFNFGWISPRYWYDIVVTIVYLPFPYFIMNWLLVIGHFKDNGITFFGIIGFFKAIRLVKDDPEVRIPVKMIGLSYVYFFVVCGIWITYTAIKGF